MAPSKQSSLDSFFGGGGVKTKKAQPSKKKIDSINNKKTKTTNDTPPPTAAESSNNGKRKTPDTEGEDEFSDTEIHIQQQPRSSSINKKKNKHTTKRRVLLEDSSSSEDEDDDSKKKEKQQQQKTKAKEATKEDVVMKEKNAEENEDDNMEVESTKAVSGKNDMKKVNDSRKPVDKATAKTASTKAKSGEKTATTTTSSKKDPKGDDKKALAASSSSKKSSATAPNNNTTTRKTSTILKAAIAKDPQFKSDAAVLEEVADAWKDDDTNTTSKQQPEMPYAVLCDAFSKIEAVTSRLAIQQVLTTLFRQILLKCSSATPEHTHEMLTTVLYLASNSVAPAYDCVELGVGDSLLIRAIQEATGTSTVKQKYETVGDLGTVAASCKSKQRTLGGFFASKTKPSSKASTQLSARTVLTVFRKIAATKGNQSRTFKINEIKKLLVKSTSGDETKYIIRGLQGKLRIGLAETTVQISLAHALALTPPLFCALGSSDKSNTDAYPEEAKQYMDKSLPVEKRLEAAVSIVRKAYSEVPSYEAILDAAMKVPLQQLHQSCSLTPGIPISPMLAKPTKSVQEVLKRLNGLRFTCEYKYDGERAQVHMLPDGTTKVFSRNLLDTSDKYPEVPSYVKDACIKDKNVESFVMDTEVVAFNRETGQLVPFQVLSTRKKKEESAETVKIQVIVQAFDLMYLNGQSLLSHTLAERRALLHEHFEAVTNKFQFAKSLDLTENGDTIVLEEFLDAAVKGQCEGLMVKTLEVNAIYEPSRRSLNWLKLKKDYLEGLGDSVDLVVLGAYHGKGKRTGVYGAYLLACYDPDTEEFQSVCKIGTGFSDDDLKTLADSLNKHKIPKKDSQYNTTDQLECDVWFDAVQVWEVKAADLSKSSAHRGAVSKTGEEGRGIGLRFPRFERVRDDKKPEEATTSDQILDMYYEQDAITGGDNDDDDDDDGGI